MVNVGKSVVQRVMLDFPIVHIATYQIHARSKNAVHPLLVRKRIVTSIVHHAHAYASQANAHPYGQRQQRPAGEQTAEYQYIGGKIKYQHGNGFDNHARTTRLAEVVVGEILIDSLTKFGEKASLVAAREAN